MSRRIGADEWKARAAALNLQWVADIPFRNDDRTMIRCLDCGNEWLVLPFNIAKGRKSCLTCSSKSSRVSDKDWDSRIQSARAKWVDGTPETLDDNSKIAECLECGERWKVSPRRLYKGSGHPHCPNRKKTPLIGQEIWNQRALDAGIVWLEPPTNTKFKTPAKCLKCGHSWSPTPSNVFGGSGCPECAKRNRSKSVSKVSDEEWDARAKKANISWRGGAPTHSRIKHPAICNSCGFEWEVLPSNISKGSGCPSCSKNAKVPQGIWDKRAASVGLRWIEPVKGRHDKSRIECLECGKIWNAEAGQVASGAGCPDCAVKKRSLMRRVSNAEWEWRASAKNLVWVEFPENNSIKKQISCLKCGYEWKVIPQTIAAGSGCPQCAGSYVSQAEWERRAKAVDVEWLEIPVDSRKPTSAKCLKCGLVWRPVPDGVRLGSGCPDCAETGYKVGQPGLLYFVERTNSKGRPARKIGITNIASSKVRLALWRRQGFMLNHQITDENGQVIYDLEQSVLKWLRHELMLPQYLDREEMPFGGATETFQPNSPTNLELISKLEFEYRSLKNQPKKS